MIQPTYEQIRAQIFFQKIKKDCDGVIFFGLSLGLEFCRLGRGFGKILRF